MLPQVVFDQIVKTSGLRSEQSRNERRGAVRVPMRGMAEARPVAQGMVLHAINVRVKDVSLTGMAILLMGKQQLPKEFVIKLSLGEGRTVTLWCEARRVSAFDGSCAVVSVMFLKMMLPGQQLLDDMPLSSVNWHTFKHPVAASTAPSTAPCTAPTANAA